MIVRVNPTSARRLGAFGFSLLIHFGVFSFLWWMPPLPGSVWGREVSSKVLSASERPVKVRKVIWLRRNERLPNIVSTPNTTEKRSEAPKKDALYVRANPAGAKHKDQFIYVREPKVPEQRALPTPNFVMIDLPNVPPPPKQDKRSFVPPSQPPKLIQPANLQEPQVEARQDLQSLKQADALSSIKSVPKPPTKKFAGVPDRPKLAPRTVTLDEPTGIPIGPATIKNPELTVAAGAGGSFQTAKVPPRKAMGLPPSLAGARAGGGGRPAGTGTLEEPVVPSGLPQTGGIPGQITAVIISANPIPDGKFIEPRGNRSAEINAGSGTGEAKGAGNGSSVAGMVVPGLSVRSGDGGNGNVASSPRSPAAEAAMTPTRPAYRPRLDTQSVSIPQWPSARRVPIQVEGVFTGRPVYSTVIPGPTGSPDWVVWFGELQPTPLGTRVIMRPPRLNNAATPTEALRPAGAGKCWVTARLSKDGKLSALRVSQGLGTESTSEFTSALQKWLWTPAIRNGEAVDVDVVMEVELKRN